MQAAAADMRRHNHTDAGGMGPLFRCIARAKSGGEALFLGVLDLERSLIVGPTPWNAYFAVCMQSATNAATTPLDQATLLVRGAYRL
jgi:hypothetical protein